MKIIRRNLLKLIWWLYGLLETIEMLIDPEQRKAMGKVKKELKEYELKFEKKDPFILEKGDWAVPYDELKKLLEE